MKIPKKCPKFGISPSPNSPNFKELEKKKFKHEKV